MHIFVLHVIIIVEVVNMTNNTQFKTLLNTWLNQKKPMITPSTHASFTLIAENHLIPHFGKRKIGSITEPDIQSYISYLYESGRLDKSGGLTVKTIRDVILVLRLAMEYAYKERAIPLLNWDLIEYPKELGIKKVVSLSKDQEQALIQCIYMNLNRKTAGILIALFTGVRIGVACIQGLAFPKNTSSSSEWINALIASARRPPFNPIGGVWVVSGAEPRNVIVLG